MQFGTRTSSKPTVLANKDKMRKGIGFICFNEPFFDCTFFHFGDREGRNHTWAVSSFRFYAVLFEFRHRYYIAGVSVAGCLQRSRASLFPHPTFPTRKDSSARDASHRWHPFCDSNLIVFPSAWEQRVQLLAHAQPFLQQLTSGRVWDMWNLFKIMVPRKSSCTPFSRPSRALSHPSKTKTKSNGQVRVYISKNNNRSQTFCLPCPMFSRFFALQENTSMILKMLHRPSADIRNFAWVVERRPETTWWNTRSKCTQMPLLKHETNTFPDRQRSRHEAKKQIPSQTILGLEWLSQTKQEPVFITITPIALTNVFCPFCRLTVVCPSSLQGSNCWNRPATRLRTPRKYPGNSWCYRRPIFFNNCLSCFSVVCGDSVYRSPSQGEMHLSSFKHVFFPEKWKKNAKK